MFTILSRTSLLLAILALSLAASAQHPLAGAWQETQVGFLVTFEQRPDGQLAGTLQGQAAPMQLNLVSDQRNAQGTFLLEGQVVGFAAQLQPDDSTLVIWLFEVDAAGQPLQGSYEQYQAYRSQAQAAPFPPVGGVPAAPGGGGLPVPPAGNQPGVPGSGGGFAQPVAPPASGGFPGAPAIVPPVWRDQPAVVLDSELFGVWEAEQKVDESLTVKILASFGADGSWRHEFSHDGNPVAFYEGTFTVSPQGAVELQVGNHSPQLCLRGNCEPASSSDIIRSFQVRFLVSDTFEMVGKDESGAEIRLMYYRISRNPVQGG